MVAHCHLAEAADCIILFATELLDPVPHVLDHFALDFGFGVVEIWVKAGWRKKYGWRRNPLVGNM